MPGEFSPVLALKLVSSLAVVVVATVLLCRQRVTARMRLAFVVGGVLVFGLLFGQLASGRMDPSPVFSLRSLLRLLTMPTPPRLTATRQEIILPIAGMLALLLGTVWVSNKSICGWGCQLGLLQDLLHRVSLPKWKPPFWLSNAMRLLAFVGLVGGLVAAGVDWIGWIDPFQSFRFDFALGGRPFHRGSAGCQPVRISALVPVPLSFRVSRLAARAGQPAAATHQP